MSNPKKSKSQKIYKMKGCSKTRKYYSRKNRYSGLASNLKGGESCDMNISKNLAFNSGPNVNINGKNHIYPSSGPEANGFNFLNSQITQGGGCNCDLNFFKGGCGSTCPVIHGGSHNVGSHRDGCKCSECKKMIMTGGSSLSNGGIPYPNGLVGKAWTPNSSSWPGVDNIPGDGNHFTLNKYNNDISRQMIDVGASPPFTIGGGKRKNRKNRSNKRQKGGVMSNLISQDLINLGRQSQFSLGSAYNGLFGYKQPVNPMPWKDQLANTPNLNTLKSFM